MNCRRIWQPVASMLMDRLRHNVPMRNYTTMGVGGPALVLAQPESAVELGAILSICRENGLPYYVMGAGSNLLFMDEGFQGVVIKLGPSFKSLKFPEASLLRAGAGASLNQVLDAALERTLGGLECLAGIPGTVGGAVWMNAGSFGGSVGQMVETVDYVSAEGQEARVSASDLRFSYRRLEGLPKGAVIVGADLRLEAGSREDIKALIQKNVEIRAVRHPRGVRSAGSVFKNPPDTPAGQIIEKCGLKGLTIGGAQVSEKHANFIINTAGEASAADVLNLLRKIVIEVKKEFGLTLEPEIRIIGTGGEVNGNEDI